MCFINYQDCRKFLRSAGHQILAEIRENLAFILARHGKAKVVTDVLQELARREQPIEDVGVSDVLALPEQLEHTPQQKRLARSDLAGEYDETFLAANRMVERGHRLIVSGGRKKEIRIRTYIERISVQIVERVVHPNRCQPLK